MSPKFKPAQTIKSGEEMQNYIPNNNSMSGIFDIPGLGGFGGIGGGEPPGSLYGPGAGRISPLSEPWELIYSNSYYMISLLRVVLTYAYVIHGPLRTLVDLPVYDAYRGGIKITTDEVSEEEKEDLGRDIKKIKLVRKLINAGRWERLYGGAAIIVNTNQDFSQEFDINSVTEESLLNFIVADRWQLQWRGIPETKQASFIYNPGGYGIDQKERIIANLHASRVFRVIGEEAPSLIRQRLQGWGMSVVECVLREVNLYFKENNVLFELIDEAKIDVWKIKGFNNQVLSKQAKGITALRIHLATWMKSFLNAITLDAEDDYIQKQVTFSGLAEIMKQIQIGIAAACRMPVSKLFGLSATGFDSGESDLETYNAIVETEREKAMDVLQMVLPIMMMRRWGFVPDDWDVEWKPLRVMTAEQEEQVKTSKHTRNMDMFDRGLMDGPETMEAQKQDGLVTIETKVGNGAEPEPPMFSMGLPDEDGEGEDGGEKKPSQGKKAKPGTAKKPKE